MSTRLLLEGPDIESLLARVRDQHGTSARIVSADKVRTGGLAGFFAKERFEVAIEVDDQPAGAASAAAPADPVADTGPAAPASLADLAEQADAAEREMLPTGPARSTEPAQQPDDFAAVLAALQQDLREVSAPLPFRPAVLGAPSSAAIEPAPAEPAPATQPTPAARPIVVTERLEPAVLDRLVELGLPRDLARAVGSHDTYPGLVDALSALPAAPTPPTRPGDILVVAGEGASAYPVATRLARRLKIDHAAVLLAASTPLGTGVPAARRVSGPADAERRSRRMHRADVPHVVAVDAPIDGESAQWARDVADAFGARAVWALVDATRKPGDLRRHLDLLGPVDALVVHNTAATADPASVLHLDRPVALLDGARATPSAWAALLCDRLGLEWS